MLRTLTNLSRGTKKALLAVVDLGILYWSLWSAFFIRLEEWWPEALHQNWKALALAPLLAIPAFFGMGLYNAVIRYIAPRFMLTILKATTVAALLMFVVVAMGQLQSVPRSTYILYLVISTVLIGGVRMVVRELLPLNGDNGTYKKRVILYGAGAAGTQTAKALQSSPEYTPVALVDDNKDIQGCEILGYKVYPPSVMPILVKKLRVDEVVISMPSVSRSRRRIIIDSLSHLPVLVKTLPGLPNILDGNVKIDDIRAVDIEDLLGRDPVQPIQDLLCSRITGKAVMVSGAGGSIGSELCRQIAQLKPKRLVLLEISEYGLYSITQELKGAWRQLEIVPVLGSVLNQERIHAMLTKYQIDTIYHAAAYKHVPMVENNEDAGVKNNVFGTLRFARAAMDARVDTFILISTDKAVRPTSVMGASKRFAELILQALASQGGPTRFTMVRFGNVLGSSGSVVPLFRKQIREGGPVTLTHPEITRYFMTIPEASQLVLQAGAMGRGGDVFLLDMGEPVRIMDLAQRMIQLSGLTVLDKETGLGDIDIVITGLRPGEKLYEELLIGDDAFPTDHPRIKGAEEESLPWQEVAAYMEQLDQAIKVQDAAKIRQILTSAVPSYQESGTSDLVSSPKKALTNKVSISGDLIETPAT